MGLIRPEAHVVPLDLMDKPLVYIYHRNGVAYYIGCGTMSRALSRNHEKALLCRQLGCQLEVITCGSREAAEELEAELVLQNSPKFNDKKNINYARTLQRLRKLRGVA